MRLHTRIQIFLAATALLPLAVYGALATHSAIRGAEGATASATATAADQIAERVEEFVRGRVDVLRVIAASVAAGSGHDGAGTRLVLSHALFADETLRHLARFDTTGEIAEHTLLPPTGLPAQMAGAAARTARTGQPYVSPVTVGPDLLPVMAVAVPITSLGRHEGVLVAEVETLELWSLARRLRLGHSGYSYILDGSGRLIAHGDPAMLARVVEDGPAPVVDVPTESSSTRARPRTYTRADGLDVVGAAAGVATPGWTVVVEKPASEAFAESRRLGWILALTLLGSLGLVSLLAWHGARWFVRPVEHLAGAARDVGAGRFDVRVDERRADEIGDLARGFNRMAVDLERLSGEIRRHERLSFFGRIAGGLAHDLKRPFQHLITQTRTLLDLPDDPRARALVEQSLDREQAYVDRLFEDLARFSQDDVLDLRPTVLQDLLERVRAAVAPMAAAAGADLVLSTDGGPPGPVLVDPMAFERAARNLVENAIDAIRGAPPGRIEIRLTSDGSRIRMEVLDDGPGVPEGLLPHLFDAFRTTKRSGSGLGLGLAVVRRIAESHGGEVRAFNRPEGGARFVVLLPRQDAAATANTAGVGRLAS